MEPETLQQILDALAAAGGETKEAFAWYLIAIYLPQFLIGMCWTIGGIGLLWMLLKRIGNYIGVAGGLAEIRAACGIKHDECYPGEWSGIISCLREHYGKQP